MRLWSQLIAIAFFLPLMATVAFCYGMGIIILPQPSVAAIHEVSRVIRRGAETVVEAATNLIQKPTWAEVKPPAQPEPPPVVAAAPPPQAEPEPQELRSMTPRKPPEEAVIKAFAAPPSTLSPPEPPHRPADLGRTTVVAQKPVTAFDFAQTGSGTANGRGMSVDNLRFHAAFSDYVDLTKPPPPVEAAKPILTPPELPKAVIVAVTRLEPTTKPNLQPEPVVVPRIAEPTVPDTPVPPPGSLPAATPAPVPAPA